MAAAGADSPSLNFTFAGLPTTYGVPPSLYAAAMRWLFGHLADPSRMPEWFLPPDKRQKSRERPEVIVVEHGGDLIWGNTPAYLGDPLLMAEVRVILVCCESVLALLGALAELERLGVRNGAGTPIFAAAPLMNLEACYQRLAPVVERGALAGVVDIAKPVIVDPRAQRCTYAEHYDRILSCADLVAVIEGVVAQTTRCEVSSPLHELKRGERCPT